MFTGEIDEPEQFCWEIEESVFKTHRIINFYCFFIF